MLLLITFLNPIIASGADPWVIFRAGAYYYCHAGADNSIYVEKVAHLEELAAITPHAVWHAPKATPYSQHIWAPELHYLQGKWYIYFAADDGNNATHRMYVLESVTDDPQGAYVFKGKIAAPDDRWAIDGTVLAMDDGKLYFIWSGWEGTENVQQNLYIAPMRDPWTISGERVRISAPEHPWERVGRPRVNEGPQVLRRNGKIHLIYSASGSWTDDYCLGQLTLTGEDPLDAAAWVKKATPIFTRSEDVFGPGHASFTRSADGKEDWIIYHSAKRKGSGWDRQVNMQPFTWDANDHPVFGSPVSPATPVPVPSREPVVAVEQP